MVRLDSLLSRINRHRFWRRRTRLGPLTVIVPSFDRWLYVKLHALGFMGKPERALLRSRVKPGMTVLDIGANIGLYSLMLAEFVGAAGKVHAFEPDPVLFRAALDNFSHNAKAHIIDAYNVAAGASAGSAVLHRTSLNSGDNRLAPSRTHHESVEVRIEPVDSLMRGRGVDWVKIDVQGWELAVLKGMEQTVASNPFIEILIEFWPEGLKQAQTNPMEIYDWFQRHGFQLAKCGDQKTLTRVDVEEIVRRNTGGGFIHLLATRATRRV